MITLIFSFSALTFSTFALLRIRRTYKSIHAALDAAAKSTEDTTTIVDQMEALIEQLQPTLLHIKLKEEIKDTYSEPQDHDSIGIFFQEDDTHIWVKPIKKDINSASFVGSPVRYLKSTVTVLIISDGHKEKSYL